MLDFLNLIKMYMDRIRGKKEKKFVKKELFLTRKEALEALEKGKRVNFHWRDKTTEITLNTTLNDLRWNLMANLKLIVDDVTNGKYSIIN